MQTLSVTWVFSPSDLVAVSWFFRIFHLPVQYTPDVKLKSTLGWDYERVDIGIER